MGYGLFAQTVPLCHIKLLYNNLQFGNIAFHIAALIMTLTKTAPEVFKAILDYGFVGIAFITVVVVIILEGKK